MGEVLDDNGHPVEEEQSGYSPAALAKDMDKVPAGMTLQSVRAGTICRAKYRPTRHV